jgi:phosphopantetheinyl transferase
MSLTTGAQCHPREELWLVLNRINWKYSAQGTVETMQTIALVIDCDCIGHTTVGAWQLPEPNRLDTSALNERSEQSRRHYLCRRLTLRALVAQYLRVPANDISIDYKRDGALELRSPLSPLYLSVSKRGSVCGFAVSPMPVGIDLEIAAGAFPIPWNVLSKHEKTFLQGLEEARRHRAFLRIWTAKEAYLKATGTGLMREPTEVSAMIARAGRVRIADRGHLLTGLAADCVEALVADQVVIATCLALPAAASRG